MERVIRLEGANNFRDMGGYAAAGGKHVRWGQLYRSDHFATLTDGDMEALGALGIRTVMDFRSNGERAQYPDRFIPARVIVLDPSSATAEHAAQASVGTQKLEDENRQLVAMAEGFDPEAFLPENSPIYNMYRTLVTSEASVAAYREMLRLLALPETPPVVMHCRGGKDRTGYGAALVLHLLGVARQDIVDDYLLTGKLRTERNNMKMAQYRQLTSDERVLEYLYSLIDTKPEFIEASFIEMEKTAGSVDAYMKNTLHADESLVAALRSLYLE